MPKQTSETLIASQGHQHRRPHRKSRTGCLNCKRRKVKCDEAKPTCSNCTRFKIPCCFGPLARPSTAEAMLEDVNPSQAGRDQRRPGRPRKDWDALARSFAQVAKAKPSPCSLNVADAQLLLHFMHHTAATLHEPDSAETRMAIFWKHNVPRIGLTYPFVLHLACALAGFHLASERNNSEGARYLSIAKQHSDAGLKQLNETLPAIDESNCGALYVSSLLVSYCAFATGPNGTNDLLVCNTGDEAAHHQLPLIHGVRLIRQVIEPATLFSGLTAPLGESMPNDGNPRFVHPHVDWMEPIARLREWVLLSVNTTIYDQTLLSLSAVYEANYGRKSDVCASPSSNRLVFGWLYRLQDHFLSCLRRKEPQALLILAYYVPLLGTIERCWFLSGWAEHLLKSIRGMLDDDLLSWLEWPTGVVTGVP
ncbi:hypothetical protein B0T10DRAFT_515835 [Thelonectria olida]|uniref:Zn(2)-C6 fungal-type domain-containing protein n=1 Tax=Thelonectria olida TaxID=1576542 RepID=A0A9P8W4A9_9HYPO|nr:hypothetical protein B0T10DRAFT_515835 [Thelonectria olida]